MLSFASIVLKNHFCINCPNIGNVFIVRFLERKIMKKGSTLFSCFKFVPVYLHLFFGGLITGNGGLVELWLQSAGAVVGSWWSNSGEKEG